jgi:hypothetical protein
MLKTNSKKARENVRAYIMDRFDASGYDFETVPETWPNIASAILEEFYIEKCKLDQRYQAGRISKFELFSDWCAGLPSIIDTCYYYNRSAVADLAAILEETPAEAARYSERDAERLLTILIYRELEKEVAKNGNNAR